MTLAPQRTYLEIVVETLVRLGVSWHYEEDPETQLVRIVSEPLSPAHSRVVCSSEAREVECNPSEAANPPPRPPISADPRPRISSEAPPQRKKPSFPPLKPRQCDTCHATFTPKSPRQLRCSAACTTKHALKVRMAEKAGHSGPPQPPAAPEPAQQTIFPASNDPEATP